eukprot:CAMPEP_0174823592 /NCGR_PEP_ID=MMETSP1107-20130205/26102_1 /TAXON_ID=36770 /ORGANISM="Paraphysomonas vestita, Strain GFlagA" /LENGTH=302 /DNA_ID=CAMNT_0016046871 /DNA_START=48 /DNA_END=953 /DNA_ORIENTATION=-
MDEFLWLQRLDQYRDDYASERLYQKEIDSNWFSAANAIRIYEGYIACDKDGNGMLNQKELLKFRGIPKRGKKKSSLGSGLGSNAVMLTPLAITRIFQENITYQPAEMDYRSFLDLILALENRDRVESMKYLWRIVNINHDGLLTLETITQFYRDIQMVLADNGYDAAPSSKDVCIEIMDMLGNPEDDLSSNISINKEEKSLNKLKKGVTFKQILSCGQGHTVLSILIDANQFWLYDNRESLSNNDSSDDDDYEEEDERGNNNHHNHSNHHNNNNDNNNGRNNNENYDDDYYEDSYEDEQFED